MTRITAAVGLTGPLLVRRFLADYARNPVNLLMLVLVPVAFVAAAAGSLSQLARLLSGTTAPGAIVPDSSLASWAREPDAPATNAAGTRTSMSRLTGLRA